MTDHERALPESALEAKEAESSRLSLQDFSTHFTNYANQPSEAFKYMISAQSEVYRWENFLNEQKEQLVQQLEDCTLQEIETAFAAALQECSDNLCLGETHFRDSGVRLEVRWKLPIYYASYQDENIHIGYIYLRT